MHAYADDHQGRLPPAVVYDKSGQPLYSWRVLLLPYLDEKALYQQFHLDEPWDSPHNLSLLERRPKVYAPPRWDYVTRDPTLTYYQVFVGPGAAFDGKEGLSLVDDIPDGTSNTVLVADGVEPVPWTKPAELEYHPDLPLPGIGGIFTGRAKFSLMGSKPPKGPLVGMADGSIRSVSEGVSEETMRHAITRNDGYPLGIDW